jgi:16S rRNA (guanine(966)-N(2))-methyltransferase RsmD
MSRIIAGGGKGRRLKSPRGLATRPTGARVRQALFDILAPEMTGARFLDAFAGSGAIGLEALSRGASRVVLVDTSGPAVAALQENARSLAHLGGEVQVFRQDARVALGAFADQGVRFDVVYLDPPYAGELYEPMLEQIGKTRLLAEGGVAVAEHFHKKVLPETIGGLVRTREVRVGDHRLSFYRRPSSPGSASPGRVE